MELLFNSQKKIMLYNKKEGISQGEKSFITISTFNKEVLK